MHHYENTEEFAYNQSTGKRKHPRKSHHWYDKSLTTVDKVLMATGVLLVVALVGAALVGGL